MSIEDLKVKPEILSPKPPSIATDEEFTAGTSTTASPTVKQAKEKLVTTDTTQAITGQKVFTNELLRKSKVIDITTQSEKYTSNNGFKFVDKNGNIMGFLENSQQADGRIATGIHAKNKDGYQQNINVWVPQSGTTGAYATAPSTPANPGDNVIVTAGYLKNNYVTLNTDQTIIGTKTYTAIQRKKSRTADISTTSDGYQANEVIRAYEKNNNVMGVYHTSVVPAALGVYGNTGEVRCAMDVLNKDGYQAGIRVNVPVEGTSGAYATCPSYDENKSSSYAIVTKDKIANMVTTNTAQTISGVKTFNSGTLQALRPILLKENNANEGGQIHFERSNNSVLKDNPYIDLLINTIRFIGINSKNSTNITLQVDLENKQVLVPTPALTANNTQAATTAWFNSKMQVVSALPANPDPNVFYFIPG